jgi:hypothetical protein
MVNSFLYFHPICNCFLFKFVTKNSRRYSTAFKFTLFLALTHLTTKILPSSIKTYLTSLQRLHYTHTHSFTNADLIVLSTNREQEEDSLSALYLFKHIFEAHLTMSSYYAASSVGMR